MKTGKVSAGVILKITAWACVLVFAIGALIYGLSTDFGFKDFQNTIDNGVYEHPHTYEEEAASLRNISVDWVSGPITLRFYDGETIQVTETAKHTLQEKEKLLLELSGSDLTIRWDSSWLNISFMRDSSKSLEILIPRQFYENLESVKIHSASSEITVEDLLASEVRFQTVSGDILLEDVEAETLRVDSTSGNIIGEKLTGTEELRVSSTSGDMQLTGIQSGELQLDTTSGDILLEGTVQTLECDSVSGEANLTLTAWPEKMDASSVSGDVEITVPETAEGFLCRFESVSGDFYSTFETQRNGELYLNGEGAAEVKLSTTSGNAKLNKAGEPVG